MRRSVWKPHSYTIRKSESLYSVANDRSRYDDGTCTDIGMLKGMPFILKVLGL